MTRLTALSGDAVDTAARLWRDAWLDGHEGRVPAALMAVRGPDHFRRYLADHLGDTTVAVDDEGRLIGLVISDLAKGEVVQLAVAADTRGGGVAGLLLDCAESRLATAHRVAWLAVVPGNTRARAFYARRGWREDRALTYAAPAGGSTVDVPVHRYVKELSGADAGE